MLGVSRQGAVAASQAASTAGEKHSAFLNQQALTEGILIPVLQTTAQEAFKETYLSQTRVTLIGRQPGAALCINHPSISRRHAEIMCIGCDRCMRACPVPLSSMVSIAELNLATISDEIPPHVARFTNECVMCGSCVPVCPVNNHRDLLMLSLKQRLSVSWDGNVDMSRILDYLPQGWNVPLLLSRLREQSMFSDPKQVPDNYLLHFVASSKILTFLPGTKVMHEGEYGREMYSILEGRLGISSIGPSGKELPVAVVRRGEFLGERGMLTGQRREVTARTETAAIVLEIPEQVMQRMMEIAPGVKTYFERLNTLRSLESLLKRLQLFQGISDADTRWLIGQTQVKQYDREERLMSEDNREQTAREKVHVLLEGFVKVARHTVAGTGNQKSDERIIAYRQGEITSLVVLIYSVIKARPV